MTDIEIKIECPHCGKMTSKPLWPDDMMFSCNNCGGKIEKAAAMSPYGETCFVKMRCRGEK